MYEMINTDDLQANLISELTFLCLSTHVDWYTVTGATWMSIATLVLIVFHFPDPIPMFSFTVQDVCGRLCHLMAP